MINRNKNTAELVGLSFGDGGLTYRKNTNRMRFQLMGNIKEDREHYDKYIINLFNREVMFRIFKRKVGIVFNKNKGFYGIGVESKKIGKYLNHLGIPNGIKGELFIPKWIKNNKEYSINFLRGLFDTDGSIYYEKNYSLNKPTYHTKIKISICSTSKNLINEVSILLNNLGIKNFIKKPYNMKKESWKDMHKVVVDAGINVDNWFKIVGSMNPKHKTKYLIWKKFRFCPTHTTLRERLEILKDRSDPYSFYTRECRSGQTG